jgi:hypothetical protein
MVEVSTLGASLSNQKEWFRRIGANPSYLVKVKTIDVGQLVGEISLQTDKMGGFDLRPWRQPSW